MNIILKSVTVKSITKTNLYCKVNVDNECGTFLDLPIDPFVSIFDNNRITQFYAGKITLKGM